MELVDFRKNKEKANCYGEIIGSSERMKQVYQTIADFSLYDYSVFITGETGTGKELVAEEMYRSCMENGKNGKCLVKMNCAAIPETLIESELFGYKKGSFTGAVKDKKGKFQIADMGILFLDETGDIPLYTQAKILQAVERGEVQPLGYEGAMPVKVKVRIIAATNKNLEKEISEGRFRRDLLFRLDVLGIHLPSLKERDDDIILLSRYFLEKHNEEYKEKKSFDGDALWSIANYDWPGNVRQLENFIKKAATMSREDVIKKGYLEALTEENRPKLILEAGQKLRDMMQQYEKKLIREALEVSGGNKKMAAEILGIDRSHLHKKIKLWF